MLEEAFKSMGDNISSLTRKDVADALRNSFDVMYHRLRSWWEHPSLRQGLHDPDRIESYRKVISTNLSQNLLSKLSVRLQQAVKSKDVWRREFLKVTSNVIRLGDTVLDGILDLLLDVLKGKGPNRYYPSQSSDDNRGDPTFGFGGNEQQYASTQDTTHASDPRMDDPSLANNLLFELSESEDDSNDTE
jgi:hypothetical protein